MSLADLATIYQAQPSASHDLRINKVSTTLQSPFLSADFVNFATIAGASLTSLVLARSRPCTDSHGILFTDFLELMSTTKMTLPNLRCLWLPMLGKNSEAEKICRYLLPPACSFGPLRELRLFSGWYGQGSFNLIRYVSQFCAAHVSIDLSSWAYEDIEGCEHDLEDACWDCRARTRGETGETRFLKYLRRCASSPLLVTGCPGETYQVVRP